MLRKTPLLKNEYYHLYNRGVDKRTIFLEERDYRRFIVLLYLCNSDQAVNIRNYFNKGLSFVELLSVEKGQSIVDIGAYCLMPNHFHLLVRGKEDDGITKFMKKVSTGYSMYFNNKHERSGSLFEGAFKAKHIDNTAYFNWVFSYIHLNPVKLINPHWKESKISDLQKTKEYINNYQYSSYSDYFIKKRPEQAILNKKEFPEHFSEIKDFEDICREFTDYHLDD